MLKLKKTVAAAVLGLGCVGFAHAASYYLGELSNNNPTLSGSGMYDGSYGADIADTFSFKVDPSLAGVADSAMRIQVWSDEIVFNYFDQVQVTYLYYPNGLSNNPYTISPVRQGMDGPGLDFEVSLADVAGLINRYGNDGHFGILILSRGAGMGLVYGSTYNFLVTATAAIPEPETYAMLLAGLGIVGAVTRRRKVNLN